ncbi:MAG: ATP-dependent Clp protease adaptor ClpS [Dehalococcoidia bacterium]
MVRRLSGSIQSTNEVAPEAPVSPVDVPDGLRERLPPYRVILHNDDVNEMGHVVTALLASVPELSPERAVDIMLQAHRFGQATVISCPLERAELYRDRLESQGLTCTIDRAR